MPGLVTSNASSLERLKVLDSLPNLDAQLHEIQQLCTHSARAEMIAKWLFAKLQSDAEVQQSVEVWNAMLSTLRLLPPERIATIPGFSTVLKTLQTALDQSHSDELLLKSCTRLLDFLWQQSNTPAGVSVKAGLSLPTSEAASFVGVWLQECLAILQSRKDAAQDSLSKEIDAGLQVWDLRKRSSDESEAFSQHCLVPCAALSALTPSAYGATTTKRKRDDNPQSTSQNTKAAIESLLARHVFVPGRAAYFKARSVGTGKKQRDVGSQRSSFIIESLLEPLRSVSAPSKDGAEAALDWLPRSLEIALRSAPTLSPTQRSHEKPWTETLFLVLHDLNKRPSGQLADSNALRGMLEVIARESCTISADVLMDIVTTHAGLGAASVNWVLMAAVVGVDAALFKDNRMARTLFDAVTSASIKKGEDSHQEQSDHESVPMRGLWRDRILVPVLHAFARYNDLTTAIELCSQQLEKDLHGTFWSVWDHLDEPIQALLEESLTHDQVLSVTLSRCQTITNFNGHRQSSDLPMFSAAIVMLNTLLRGISSERTLDKLYPHLEASFEALMQLHDAHIGPGLIPALQERRCWSLMTTIFELWFPHYAAQESDAATVIAKMAAFVPQSVLKRAVGLTATVHCDEYASVQDPQSASDAKCLVACICTQVLAHKSTVDEKALRPFAEALDALGRQGKLDSQEIKLNSAAFVRYPDSVSLMSPPTRQALLQNYAIGAISGSSGNAVVDLGVLKALGSAAAARAQSHVVDDLITASFASLEYNEVGIYEDFARVGTMFADMLSDLPARALTRPQREKVLDKIGGWGLERAVSAPMRTQVMKPCLPLMLRLMELPNPTARICLEPEMLSSMAADLNNFLQPQDEDSSTFLASFEALVSLIIQQCIRTKDQERSKTMLIGLSSEAMKVVKTSRSDEDATPTTQFTLAKVVFRDLETTFMDDMKLQLQHRKPPAVKKLVGKLAKNIDNGLQTRNEDALLSLDLLGAIPSTVISTSGFDMAQLLASLATFLDVHMEAYISQGFNPATPITRMTMVRCYETLGKFAPSTPNTRLAMFADRLMQLRLDPAEHAVVLSTFESLAANLGSSRAALIEELLDEYSSMPASRLLLLRVSIAKLEKADFEERERSLPTQVLHRLLLISSASKDFTTSRRSLACTLDILKAKTFMVNQYNIEVTLQVLQQLAQRGGAGKNILYLDICSVLSTLLLHHRSRLQGRFHMVIKLLQMLMSRLFQPLHGWDKATARRPPTTKHAAALSRLLKLFCEPPHLRKPQQHLSLVDESRKEQAHVGTFVQHILHHYCAQILHGTLGEGTRDALTSGLRAMIEAMEMNGAEGGKALSAAMGNSERAVLRGLYEEWRRFGKWRGA